MGVSSRAAACSPRGSYRNTSKPLPHTLRRFGLPADRRAAAVAVRSASQVHRQFGGSGSPRCGTPRPAPRPRQAQALAQPQAAVRPAPRCQHLAGAHRSWLLRQLRCGGAAQAQARAPQPSSPCAPAGWLTTQPLCSLQQHGAQRADVPGAPCRASVCNALFCTFFLVLPRPSSPYSPCTPAQPSTQAASADVPIQSSYQAAQLAQRPPPRLRLLLVCHTKGCTAAAQLVLRPGTANWPEGHSH